MALDPSIILYALRKCNIAYSSFLSTTYKKAYTSTYIPVQKLLKHSSHNLSNGLVPFPIP